MIEREYLYERGVRLMNILKILSLNLVMFFSLVSFADRYYLSPVGGSSSEEDMKLSVFELIGSGLKEQNQEVVSDKTQADFVIETQLLKLGSAYLITVHKSEGGKIILSKKMKASSAEEIDKAASRLSRVLVSQAEPANEARIGEITNEETTKLTKRTETLDFSTYSLGAAGFDNLKSSKKNMPSMYFGTGYQYDVTEQSAIRLNGELAFRQDSAWASIWGLNIGYGYYFRNAQTTPFMAFDFGYGGSVCQGLESVVGMTLGAQLGIGMFRTSHKQMSLSLRYLHLYKDNGSGQPSMFGFMISALL
jgi:hypothetical protein